MRKVKYVYVFLCLLCSLILGAGYWTDRVETTTIKNVLVVIDAGHGYPDPGKHSRMQNEENINLQIAKKIEKELIRRNIRVLMTRNSARGLCRENAEWDKKEDMKIRKEIIEKSSAQIFVSIHQNAFPDSRVRGAQVFYTDEKKENAVLGRMIQFELGKISAFDNKRMEKVDNELFILKHNTMPSVLIECGFLSNPQEEQMLNSVSYQTRIANAICDGIVRFIHRN